MLAPCSELPAPGIVEGDVLDGVSVARAPGVVTPVVPVLLPDVAPVVLPDVVALGLVAVPLGLVAVPLGLVVVELDCAKATLVPTSSATAATEERNNFILAYLQVWPVPCQHPRRGTVPGRNPGGAEACPR
jgi:hypothetical protein